MNSAPSIRDIKTLKLISDERKNFDSKSTVMLIRGIDGFSLTSFKNEGEIICTHILCPAMCEKI